MPILFATDFSPCAERGGRVAAVMARRLDEPLVLAHVVDPMRHDAAAEDAPLLESAGERLRSQAAELRRDGTRVLEELLVGAPDEELSEAAERLGASLVVLASLSQDERPRLQGGRVSERAARTSTCPVLVLKDGRSLAGPLLEGRSLRVVAGMDFSATALAALGVVPLLRRLLPCDLVLAHVYAPADEYTRLGLRPHGHEQEAASTVEMALARDLAARAAAVPELGDHRIVVRPSTAPTARALIHAAEAEGADLVLIGSHQRKGLSRLWYGSVAQGVLHHAPMAVACVPLAAAHVRPRPPSLPPLHRVLVPTDLSETGDRAIPYGFAMAGPGGIVYLLHVTPPSGAAGAEAAAAALRARIPAATDDVETVVQTAVSTDVADTICQAAERLGVDAVCVASHGRPVPVLHVLGSVAHAVLRRATRPVFVIPPPR